jgi:hypothetical protein
MRRAARPDVRRPAGRSPCCCQSGLGQPAVPHRRCPAFGRGARAHHVPSDAWLLARDGQPLQRLRLDPQVRRLPWTPLGKRSRRRCAAR